MVDYRSKMSTEFKIGPVSRNALNLVEANKRKTRVWSGLQFRKTPEGIFEDIDETSVVQTISAKGVPMLLRDKTSVCSVGVRTDGQTAKAVGLWPDDDQSGKIQFEISAPIVTFDGKAAGSPVSAVVAKDARTSDLGAFLVRARRQGMRVLVPATNKIKDFRIEFRLDLTRCYMEKRDRGNVTEFLVFKDSGEFWFRIAQPHVIDPNTGVVVEDSDGVPLEAQIDHSLTQNSDKSYTYAKYPGSGFTPELWPANVWIDVDIIYAETSDGRIAYVGSGGESWSTVRNAVTGTYGNFNSANRTVAYESYTDGSDFVVFRSVFAFDLSGLSGTVQSGTVNICGNSGSGIAVSIQKGIQADSPSTADYDSFTGSYYDIVSPYNISDWNVWTLNAAGISDMQSVVESGLFKICAREYTHDYLDSAPGGTYAAGCYYSEDATRKPFVEITWVTGTFTLSIADTSHALTSDVVTLAKDYYLTIAATSHALSSQSLRLTVSNFVKRIFSF